MSYPYSPAIGYTSPVSQSCEIGIGLPVESVAKSRIRKTAAFSIPEPFMAVRARRLRPRQLPLRGFTGSPTRLDCRPDWTLGCSRISTEPKEPIMANSLALVPVFTGTLQAQSVQLCDARALHSFMEVLRDFSNWIKGRIRKFGFVNGVDFITISRSPDLASGNRGAAIDYHLTLDMAKELAMVENNPKGREARRYFIACEKQSLAILTAPGQLALDYARINPAQAQTLKELVQTVVDSGAQGYGETWSRLHKKFRVNSYLELSAEQFEQACDYLRAKAPQALVLDAARITQAFALAAEVANQASQTVFAAVMAGDDQWKHDRWLFCLRDERGNQGQSVPWAKAIDRQANVMSLEHLALAIAEPGGLLPSNRELANLAAACNQRLATRLEYPANKNEVTA